MDRPKNCPHNVSIGCMSTETPPDITRFLDDLDRQDIAAEPERTCILEEIGREDASQRELPAREPHGNRAVTETELFCNDGLWDILDVVLDKRNSRLVGKQRKRPVKQHREFVTFELQLEIDLVIRSVRELRRLSDR